MKNIDRLKGFDDKLDEVLEWFPQNRIKSIVFTRRGDHHSVALIQKFSKGLANDVDDEANFERMCGYNFPQEWYETTDAEGEVEGWISFCSVDLDSVGTDKLRVYKNQPNLKPADNISDWWENKAYYIDTKKRKVIGEKHYLRSLRDRCYYINYYDENGNLVAERQKEVEATKEDWNGSEELFNIVNEEEWTYVFSKKENKDQAYFIVHIN